jgi:uncharacterized membrane protein
MDAMVSVMLTYSWLQFTDMLYFTICVVTCVYWGPLMVAQWLRYCATNRKVAGSIPNGVIGIFH